jgi:hypothetical protein
MTEIATVASVKPNIQNQPVTNTFQRAISIKKMAEN